MAQSVGLEIPRSETPVAEATAPPKRLTRIVSLDAFRGLVMVLMLNERTRLPEVARSFPHSAIWALIAYNTEHVDWQGCSLHDLIQPAFSFLVGAALPFSIAARKMKGETFGQMLGHAIRRAFILIFLGIFLRSLRSDQTYFTFEDTLTQIGLGYVFLFLFGFTRVRTQVIAFVLILICFWAAFALYPRARPKLRLPRRRRSAKLGSQLHRLSLALEQELQSLLGIRQVVSESVSARASLRFQRGRMVHPEFHSNPRDHDSRAPHGRMAQSARDKRTKIVGARHCGRRLVVRWPRVSVGRDLSHRETSLDLLLHPL